MLQQTVESIPCCCNPNTLTTTTTSQPIPRRPIWFGTDWLMYKITSLLLRSLLKIPQPLFISVELYTVFLSFAYDCQCFISWTQKIFWNIFIKYTSQLASDASKLFIIRILCIVMYLIFPYKFVRGVSRNLKIIAQLFYQPFISLTSICGLNHYFLFELFT